MKMIKTIVVVWLLFCLCCWSACRQDETVEPSETDVTGEETEDIIPGILKVKFSREVADSLWGQFQEETGEIGKQVCTRATEGLAGFLGDVKVRPLFKRGGRFAERRRAAGLDQWFCLEYDPEKNINALLRPETRASLGGAIECIEPAYRVVFNTGVTMNEQLYALVHGNFLSEKKVSVEFPFNDPKLGMQWHYDRGTVDAAPEAGVGLFAAWQKTAGSPEVIVAVLDQGIDWQHEDLKANMWVNEVELNGVRREDDDDNGYADDVYGYNFARNVGAIDPMEHGTHVAGTIAAVNNNGVGVCGVAGGSGNHDGVRVMACQITANGLGMSGIEDAFAYAADNGAVICSCSWYLVRAGSSIEAAIDYFNAHAGEEGGPMKGGVVFFAAGNDNRQNKIYPPAWENVVAVASLDRQNRRSSFSNYGDWVELAAPGGGSEESAGNILSTLPGNQYGYQMGTSMACPHVAGIAALVVSAHRQEADFTPERLKEILYASVTDLKSMEPNASLMGKGLLRADLALGADEGLNIKPGMPAEVQWKKELQAEVSWKVQADAKGNLPLSYAVYTGLSPLALTKPYEVVPAGEATEGQRMVCRIKPWTENGEYEILVQARNLWGKLSDEPERLKVTWNNDYTAPEVVTDAAVAYKDGIYALSWIQVADKKDGSAAAYNICCRDEERNLCLDTTVWVGKQEAGKMLHIGLQLAAGTTEKYFTFVAIDEWGNQGKESKAFSTENTGGEVTEVKVWPNPVDKEVNVAWTTLSAEEKTIRIYDNAARLVFRTQVDADGLSCRVDLSALAPGWYTLVFETGGQKKNFTIRKR